MKQFFTKRLSLFWIAVLLVFSATTISAQETEFNTDGLYNAEFFDYIYRGHFENIELSREDVFFLGILEKYLRAYGEQCPTYLPTNKVKIMEQVCASEMVTTNGYGVETSRYCVEWKWVWTRLYARPDLYNAKLEVEKIQGADALKNVLEYLTNPNALGNSVDLAHKAKGLQMDMARIFKMNSCNSEALRRFEENIKLFALNKPSIRMQGSSKYATMKKSGGPKGLQDFNKLIDDLVSDQAKTWMFNRYNRGSISAATILSKDEDGKPTIIKANYLFSAFSGNSKGWVKIVFKNGLPSCIYFWDFPSNCKTPSSSIVASYAQGKYNK